MYMGMGSLRITPTESTWSANIDPASIKGFLSVNDWWQQVVYVRGPAVRLARKNIVLAAANKDGGAHVDASLTPEYTTLISSGELGFFRHSHPGEPDTSKPIMDAHLVYIRQMGHELLSSPELLAL
jgi:hypothetical protein